MSYTTATLSSFGTTWLFLVVASSTPVSAAVVFEQDFNSSTTVGDYVSATPNNGQFNDISADGTNNTVAVTSGALVFDMNDNGSADTSGFLRSTDLASPAPTVLAIELLFTYTKNGSNTSGPGPVLQVGNYPSTATGYTSGGSANDRFDDLTWRRTGSDYQLELNDTDPVAGGVQGAIPDLVFGQQYSVLWLLNNSGASQSYTGPDGESRTINNNSSTLFLDGVLATDNRLADDNGGANIDLSSIRFRALDVDNSFSFDLIRINDSLPIPEPASVALLGLGGLLIAARRRAGV